MTTQAAGHTFYIAICAGCGGSFTARRAGAGRPQVYCSKDCKENALRGYNTRYYHRNKERLRGHYIEVKGEGMCEGCKFRRDCDLLIWDVKFTPYCFEMTMDDKPNRLHRLWEGEK